MALGATNDRPLHPEIAKSANDATTNEITQRMGTLSAQLARRAVFRESRLAWEDLSVMQPN
jgi:hypothetical protein